jgi:putative endonuclease
MKMSPDQWRKFLGARGEAIAAKYLQHKGYKLIDRNYHAAGGEIDLVTKSPDGEYVLVEVKARSNDSFGDGAASITQSKFNKILQAGEAFFLKKLELSEVPDFRVEAVILQLKGEKVMCEHITDIGEDDFA